MYLCAYLCVLCGSIECCDRGLSEMREFFYHRGHRGMHRGTQRDVFKTLGERAQSRTDI